MLFSWWLVFLGNDRSGPQSVLLSPVRHDTQMKDEMEIVTDAIMVLLMKERPNYHRPDWALSGL